jgi:outer membrane protein assembly factor BamB
MKIPRKARSVSPRLLLFLFALGCSPLPLCAADWPTYRCDAARSGYTAEEIPNQMRLRWTFNPGAAPRPAWMSSDRIEFDQTYQPVLAGGLLLFGSSADDQVVALNVADGAVAWRFFTEGPVRFAPAVWHDLVFVCSDDGFLYALGLQDGKIRWRHHAGPRDQRVLGNERMVSQWPARGGVVVKDDIVYYAGGIWPSEGVYLHALDANTGRSIWKNEETGRLEMKQPHGGAVAVSGVAPQGYLVASDDAIVVPTGRAVPAVFERADGKLRFYKLSENQRLGGTRTLWTDSFFLNSGHLFDGATGNISAQFGMGSAVAVPGGVVRAEGRSVSEYRWTQVQRIDRKGQPYSTRVLEQSLIVPLEEEVSEFIVAGRELIIGTNDHVLAVDYKGQKNVFWRHKVEGRVLGLAAANGRLAVSTDRGFIYLFDGKPGGQTAIETGHSQQSASASQRSLDMSVAAERRDRILDAAKTKEGFAVLIGAGDHGQLAQALATATNWTLLCLEPDAHRAQKARERLAQAGLYGSRTTVHCAQPANTGYPDSFADVVIVLGDAANDSSLTNEWKRMQRPFSGLVCTERDGRIVSESKSAPAGVGSWTHQNGNAANTLCSDDAIVRGALSLQWYRDVDFEIVNRHGQGPAPLVSNGLMIVGGVHGLCCIDVYNGRRIWEYSIPDFLADYDGIHHDVGVGDTGSPFCIGGDSVFFKQGPHCVRLDLHTGRKLSEYKTPAAEDAKDRNWGVLLWDSNVLFGSIENSAHNVSPRYELTQLRTESVALFAIDPKSGQVLWKHEPKDSIRHNTVAAAGGRVYFIDKPLATVDRVEHFDRLGRALKRLPAAQLATGALIALDAGSGRELWRNTEDIWGTQLGVSERHNVVLMNYKAVHHSFFELPSESGGRLAGFDAQSGRRLWQREAQYETRPVINDTKILAHGGAWDLKTGAPLDWNFQRSYGCSQISSSKNMLLYRSATLGYMDITKNTGTQNFGGIRPSCWINAVPASGMVLVPDGSAKCTCSYQMRSWFALRGE